MDFTSRYGPWAFVTGASAGLGEFYCRQLAERGFNLVMVARRADKLLAIAAELEAQFGIQTRVMTKDLIEPDAITELTAAVAELEIGLLVNNAGFGWRGSFVEASAQLLQNMVRLNCEVPTLLSHALLPAMMERKRGGMLLLASTAAFQPTPFFAVYGASKGYDLLLGEALHVEMSKHGVDVLAVCPGSTDTEFHQVAGTESSFPVMADPADVVQQSLALLGKRMTFVHGFKNRMMVAANRLAPRRTAAKVSARIIQNISKP